MSGMRTCSRALQCAALLLCFGHVFASTTVKNVVIMLLDDLGYHDLGFTGSGVDTPQLDQLRSEGILLTDYRVQTICTPSRAALLTGRVPVRFGMQGSMTIQPGQPWGLPLNETLLPQILQMAGGGAGTVATAAVGKWHLLGQHWRQAPTFRGFDSFYGYYWGAESYTTHYNGPGYDLHRDSSPNCGPNCSLTDWSAQGTYSAYLFAAEAERVIAAHDTSKPLFLYLAWQSVHAPIEAPASYIKPYLNRSGFADPLRATHAGMLAVLDEAVGNVTAALAAAGMLEDTLIVVSNDNGGAQGLAQPCGDCNGALNWPLRGNKHSLYEGGVRGTGFVWSPALYGRAGPTGAVNRTWNGAAHITDWLPTTLSWMGLSGRFTPAPGFELDGFDLSTALAAAAAGNPDALSPRSSVLLALNPTCNGSAAIKQGEWKLLVGDPGPPYGWDPANTTTAITVSPHDFVHLATLATAKEAGTDGAAAPPPPPNWFCGQDAGPPTPPVPQLWPLLNTTVALYNLTADPREETDVSADHPDVVAQLMTILAQWGAQQAWPIQNATTEPASSPSLHNGTWVPWEY